MIRLHSSVEGLLVNSELCETKSSTSVARSHNSVIVHIDLVDTVVLVGAVQLSQDRLSKVDELGNVTGLSVPDKSVDLFIDDDITLAEGTHKLILV